MSQRSDAFHAKMRAAFEACECEECEARRTELAALHSEINRLSQALVDAEKQRDGCRSDASRMGQLWQQAVKDWKAAQATVEAVRCALSRIEKES